MYPSDSLDAGRSLGITFTHGEAAIHSWKYQLKIDSRRARIHILCPSKSLLLAWWHFSKDRRDFAQQNQLVSRPHIPDLSTKEPAFAAARYANRVRIFSGGCPTFAYGRSCMRRRSSTKAEQILEGAREVFLESGYEGASTDEIVRRSNVSKATVYKYFPSKAELFEAVVSQECASQSRILAEFVQRTHDSHDPLFEIARSYVSFLLSPFAVKIYRIAVGETLRFPEIGRIFHRSGPERATKEIAAVLQTIDGLHFPDPEMAARQFVELCKADYFFEVLFDLRSRIKEEEISLSARNVADTFRKAFSASRKGRSNF
jgi:AcrR family transcriptional regulator